MKIRISTIYFVVLWSYGDINISIIFLNKLFLHSIFINKINCDSHTEIDVLKQIVPEGAGGVFVFLEKKLTKGKFYDVKITNAYEYDVVGEINNA